MLLRIQDQQEVVEVEERVEVMVEVMMEVMMRVMMVVMMEVRVGLCNMDLSRW